MSPAGRGSRGEPGGYCVQQLARARGSVSQLAIHSWGCLLSRKGVDLQLPNKVWEQLSEMAAPQIVPANQANYQVKNGYHVKTWGDGSR